MDSLLLHWWIMWLFFCLSIFSGTLSHCRLYSTTEQHFFYFSLTVFILKLLNLISFKFRFLTHKIVTVLAVCKGDKLNPSYFLVSLKCFIDF